MFILPLIMIQLCNVNQQNVLFNLTFYFSSFVFNMFRTSYVHHQEDYTVHPALYAMFFIQHILQSDRLFAQMLEKHNI